MHWRWHFTLLALFYFSPFWSLWWMKSWTRLNGGGKNDPKNIAGVGMNRDLALCAQINFQNCEDAMPFLKKHPYWVIAKAQLNEALGGRPAEEVIQELANEGTRMIEGHK